MNSALIVDERNISIEFGLTNNKIEIIYSDNGKGLDKALFDNKEDIFLPFTTSKKDRNGNEIGTGLGMYLVKSVIEDNNGNIEIHRALSWICRKNHIYFAQIIP